MRKNTKQNYGLWPCLLALIVWLLAAPGAVGQGVPSPEEVYGFRVGDDYKLAGYAQMLDYYEQLAAASPRVQLTEIGRSTDGRPMLLLFISSEQNLARLEHWREISEKLARARIGEAEAGRLSQEGKAIVWIDGGMHASELAHGQMTAELAWRVATEETPEMQHIREHVIFLLMPVMNPDGVDIVGDWYKKQLGTPYETSSTPWLYQRYVGHDNNRDWFTGLMKETQAVMKPLYEQWYPQIVYNQHQVSPNWTRIFIPPFLDPVNQKIHPGVTASVNEVGSAMMKRFAMKKMPGAISGEGAGFTMFWNGGGRTAPYYHNQIGILTETAHSSPTPSYYEPKNKPEYIGGLRTDGSSIFYPYPWEGGASHFRQAVDFMIEGSLAVLNYGADRRVSLLYNIWQMGRDAIEAGGPYAYVVPAGQRDNGEAVNMVNMLLRGGVEAERAVSDFSAGGRNYPAGSFILKTAQPFRAHLEDVMERQDYPTRLQYPGGPPVPPYDITGWTLPLQMGVQVERIEQAFTASAQPVSGLVSPGQTKVEGGTGYGYALSPNENASFHAVNRLLGGKAKVARLMEASDGLAAGSFVVTGAKTELIKDMGLSAKGLASKPGGPLKNMKRPKVGIYKSWQANMDEGWTRWIMEQYEFDIDTLHNADVQRGSLKQYDAIILPAQAPSSILHGASVQRMPEAYAGGIELEGTLALNNYVKGGGTLITFDAASDFAIEQFGLPVRNVVGNAGPERFFIPGTLLRIEVETEHPLAYGMQESTAAVFGRSRAFAVGQGGGFFGFGGQTQVKAAPQPEVEVVARYAREDLVMSGWAMGENLVAGQAAMVNVKHGSGQVVLFAFKPQFRAQPRGTYKLFLNAIMNSSAK